MCFQYDHTRSTAESGNPYIYTGRPLSMASASGGRKGATRQGRARRDSESLGLGLWFRRILCLGHHVGQRAGCQDKLDLFVFTRL